jgi:hypothetical protein
VDLSSDRVLMNEDTIFVELFFYIFSTHRLLNNYIFLAYVCCTYGVCVTRTHGMCVTRTHGMCVTRTHGMCVTHTVLFRVSERCFLSWVPRSQ